MTLSSGIITTVLLTTTLVSFACGNDLPIKYDHISLDQTPVSEQNPNPHQMVDGPVDISTDPYAFESETLYNNRKFNPSVGNGHLATTIYRDAIFVNGIYNGFGGLVHRARIPSVHASRINFPDDECSNPYRLYRLDIQNATYEETMVLPGATVTYRVYAHQYFNRLLVTDVIIERNQSSSCGPCCDLDITVTREDLGSRPSTDLVMEPRETYPSINCLFANTDCFIQSGQIATAETETVEKTNLTIYWNAIPDSFLLPQGQDSARWTFIISVDQSNSIAKENFDKALEYVVASDADGLHSEHRQTFQTVWDSGTIEIQGDLHLHKVILGSLYYLYTSLPSHSTYSPNNQFNGLSPGGLANGRIFSDYLGHVFWDMETWMYPGILMFRPDLARDMLSYRIHRMDPAFERAALGGYEGIRFPWESALTGYEVTPYRCPACSENQVHITGDIAFAARQYVSATRDEEWLNTAQAETVYTGLDFLVEMARFWNSRAVFNETTQRYDINGVMSPDEYAEYVNNSVYTNLMASYSIHFAKYAACIVGDDMRVPDSWINLAQNLAFPFNSPKRYHEEYDGYDYEVETNTSNPRGVKQADIVMLGFPLMWEMPEDVRRNDLTWYESVTDSDGPAMTWGVFSAGWLDLEEFQLADDLFNRAYQTYAREPFKVWSEVVSDNGAVNFITGMGGFLQTVLFGYGGMRLEVDQLHFRKSRLPPGTTYMAFRNLDYQEMTFDWEMDHTFVTLTVTSVGSHALYLNTTEPVEQLPLSPGFSITIPPQAFRISSYDVPDCPMLTAINVDYSSTRN